jgi:hypothetical protein
MLIGEMHCSQLQSFCCYLVHCVRTQNLHKLELKKIEGVLLPWILEENTVQRCCTQQYSQKKNTFHCSLCKMGRFTHREYHDKFTLGVERVHDVVQQYPLLARRWVDMIVHLYSVPGFLLSVVEVLKLWNLQYLFRTTTIFLWFVTRGVTLIKGNLNSRQLNVDQGCYSL